MDDTAGLSATPFKSHFTARPLIQLFSTYYVPGTTWDDRQSPQPHRTDMLEGRDRKDKGHLCYMASKEQWGHHDREWLGEPMGRGGPRGGE